MKTLKKYLSCLMAVMLIFSSVCGTAITAFAADLVSGDYSYVVVNNSYAKVTGYSGSTETVTIPSKLGNYTVKSIGENAFLDNESITSVTIPSTVTEISDGAFFGCYGLSKITVASGNKNYTTYEGVLYTKDFKRLVTYPAAKTASKCNVRSETTAIADGAFAFSLVETVVLPNTITYLGKTAFFYCADLSNINIPSGITKIGDQTFYQCESLESLTLSSGVTIIGERAFARCSFLQRINLPNKIKSIGAYAFNYCESLSTITIPSSLTTIEEGVFQCCFRLKNVVFSQGLKTIGKAAFAADSALTVVNIPDGVTTIEAEAFNYCTQLANAYIYDTVNTVGNEAFGHCNNITIHCIKNSAAHTYAVDNSLSYEFFVTAPQIITTESVGSKSVKIIWTKGRGADGYVIMRSDVENVEGQVIDEVNSGTTLSYTDNNTIPNTSRYYTVKAYCINADNSRVYSDVSCAVAGKAAIPTPKITSAAPNGISSITLKWNKIDDVDGYNIYRTTKNGSWSSTLIATVNGGDTTSYTDTSIAIGTQYYYTMRAFADIDGTVYSSSYEKAGTAGKAEISVPTIKTKATGFTSISLSWDKVDCANGYYIYRTTTDGKWSSTLIATVVGGDITSYTDSSVAYGTQYYYSIRAYIRSNGTIYKSNYNKAGTAGKGAAVAPIFTVASAKYNSVKVSWNKISGASGYYIYRTTKSDNTGWSLIKTITSGSTVTYTDSTCTCGTTYYYTIRSYRTVNGSAVRSGYLKYGKACKPIPSTPKVAAVQQSNKSVVIKWNKIAGTTKYRIYRRQVGGSWTVVKDINDINTLTYTDKPVSTTTQYEYTVKAYCGSVAGKYKAVLMTMYTK